jgi:glycosidase
VTTTINPPLTTLGSPRRGRVWFLALLLVLVACADTSSTPPHGGAVNCTVGTTTPCACDDGRLGAQTCLVNHTLGECVCAGVSVGDSGGMQPGQDGSGMQRELDSGAAVRDSSTRDAAVDAANAGDASTPSTVVPDPRDAVIYQVNLRAFSEKGFQGVIDRLDQIQALGVNVVYLMPVTPVGVLKSANSPYCVRNYKEVNADFGTLDDLRALIAGAHQRGMAVILDWVANHTAWDNPWITEHPDWYERDANGVIQPGKVGTFVYPDVAKLNFANQDMRLAMVDALRYWIFTVNSDGYRYDLTDVPPIDFWVQANGNLRSITGRKLILYAEGGRLDNYKAFDYNHGFSFYDALKQMFGGAQAPATRVESENAAQYVGAGESNRLVRYITNHDVNGWDGPPQNIFGGQAGAIAAFVLAAYNRAVPFIYNGQEIALSYALTFPFTMQKINWAANKPVTDEYIKLIKFYKQSEALRRGMPTSYSNNDVSAFVKQSTNDKALVMVNIRNRTVTFNLPAALANTTWYDGFDKTQVKLGTNVNLAPYQYMAMTAAP